MSLVLNKTLLLTGLLSFAAALAFIPSASAQDVSKYHQEPSNPQPGIRYTTGSITTAGWERSLTDGDPNLKRWNWSSMTTYTQSSYNRVPAGAFLNKSKPNQVQALRPTGSIYTKPIRVSADTYAKKRIQPGVIVIGESKSQGNVSGRVNLPKQVAQAAPAPKSYNINYGVSGKVRVPKDSQDIANRQVYGHLMKTQ